MLATSVRLLSYVLRRQAHLLLVLAMFLFAVSRLYGQANVQSTSQSAQPEPDSITQAPTARALKVLEALRFDPNSYISFVIDKSSAPGILNDSDIRPFVVPVALDANWWLVLFVPQNIKQGPPICVYLDKHVDGVRGYIIGPPMKQKTPPPHPSGQK